MAESQAFTQLVENLFDDPTQLSQLLAQRAGSDEAFHFTTSPESHSERLVSAPTIASAEGLLRHPTEALLQLNATSRLSNAPSPRRVPSTRHVIPNLPISLSAPTSTGVVLEREGARKMHRSFPIGEDAPGDTQADSQLHRQYTSSTRHDELSSRIAAAKSLFTEHTEGDEDDDILSEESEIVESSQEHISAATTSPTMIHEDEAPGPEEQHSYAPTSPLKFQTPGVKHVNSGHLLSSAARTNITPDTAVSKNNFPAFDFGGMANMSLTQAYNNTQAPTSPVALEPVEDAAFSRPSPNFAQARPTSPLPALSSPTKTARPGTPLSDPPLRSSSEPRAEYVSMKESQERRKRTQRGALAPHFEHEDSWEQPSEAQLQWQRAKAREMQQRKAALDLSTVSAPSPESPQRGRKRIEHHDLVTPIQARSSRRTKSDPDNMSTVFKSVRTLIVNVPDMDRHYTQEVSLTTPAPSNGSSENVQVPQTSSHAPRNSNVSRNGSPSRAYPQSQPEPIASRTSRHNVRPESSKDSVAVMDSQPDTTADYDSIPRPKSLRFPSSPSINAYSINQTTMGKTGYTSQIISSSMPPMPPQSSPEETDETSDKRQHALDEERVPSSPPIVAHEDDLTYDEHEHEQAYDEYAGEQGTRNSTEPQTPSGEQAPADDHDIHTIKEEYKQAGNGGNAQEADSTENTEAVHAAVEEHAPVQQDDPESPHLYPQETVPETDAVDETQPSFFPTDDAVVALDETQASRFQIEEPAIQVDDTDPVVEDVEPEGNGTNSTEPFHTAREELGGMQPRQPVPASSTEDAIESGDRLRSLDDLANISTTQQAHTEEEFEIPRLSELDENSEDVSLHGSSPARPAKRRKVTYTAKRGAFRSPVKPQPATDPAPVQQNTEIASEVAENASLPKAATAEADAEDDGPMSLQDACELPTRKTATLKSKLPQKQNRAGNKKKGSLKTITKELLQSLSSPHGSPGRSNRSEQARAQTPITPSKSRIISNVEVDDVDMADAEQEHAAVELPNRAETSNIGAVDPTEHEGDSAIGEIVLPNRILASWPGSHYYPATCLGKVTGRQLQIRFDDGNTTSLEATLIRVLDLRPGDQVKVDESGMKKHTYVVVGFKDRIDTEGIDFPVTDCRGHATVILEEKQRDSMPAAKAVQAPKHVSVPVGSIYLTTQLWSRFRNRSCYFSPPASPSKSNSGSGTPMVPVVSTEAALTPSFIRKGTLAPSLLRDATTRGASVASSSARSGSGTFSNMAFVLTSTAADIDKEAIARTIRTNGGLILEDGFHELFDLERAEIAPSSPRLSSSQELDGLNLKQQFKHLGFVALISDSHSRSTKYIQALALNVPCLHSRWVDDSLSARRAMPFSRYLLPAGVSKFLDSNGVVRSRTMTTYDPSAEDVTFANTISHRDLLLREQSVMLVIGKSKKEIERRQPFVFLTHALGATHVGRCADLPAARDILNDQQWDWIYVDNGEQGVADAAGELFGVGRPSSSIKTKKSKKRKRDATEEKEDFVARGVLNGRNIKITSSEFVIQSLILGALVEE